MICERCGLQFNEEDRKNRNPVFCSYDCESDRSKDEPKKVSSYEKQGLDFLEKSNTKMSASLIGYEKHYFGLNDEFERPIYRVTLKNKNGLYVFKFAQSVNGGKPTAYDILACLTKYEPSDFKDFCIEYGYEAINIHTGKTDKESMRTYKKVCTEWKNVFKLWNEEEIELLREIQ